MRVSILTAIVLLMAYAAFLHFGPHPTEARTQSFWQDNRVTVERYLRSDSAPPVVFVGSSLTKKLDFGQSDSACVYNLAIGGDSVLTGLRILNMSRNRPRMVFVEINVPERAANSQLIEESSSWLSRVSPVFYTENRPVNLIYSFLYQLKANRDDPPVSPGVFRGAMDVQKVAYARLIPPALLQQQVAEVGRLSRALRAAGVQVTLVELPVQAELEQLPYAVQVRDAFMKELPDFPLINYIGLVGPEPVQTLDGVHLETRSVRSVIGKLGRYYRAACGGSG